MDRDGEVCQTEADGPFVSLEEALDDAERWLNDVYGPPFYSQSYLER